MGSKPRKCHKLKHWSLITFVLLLFHNHCCYLPEEPANHSLLRQSRTHDRTGELCNGWLPLLAMTSNCSGTSTRQVLTDRSCFDSGHYLAFENEWNNTIISIRCKEACPLISMKWKKGPNPDSSCKVKPEMPRIMSTNISESNWTSNQLNQYGVITWIFSIFIYSSIWNIL